VEEAWSSSTFAAAKPLELLSLEPGINWPGCLWLQRHHQMVVSEPNVIALNPSNGAQAVVLLSAFFVSVRLNCQIVS
jgi:hypothetical protein